MRTATSRLAAALVISLLTALAIAAPAGAIPVSGEQKAVNETAGRFKMKGDMLGKFKLTKFVQLHTSPTYAAKGRERFNGCLDLDRDRSCAGDLSGKLFFKFKYWASFDDDGELQLGTCAHRIVGGTGSFTGATGFLMMVDRPQGGPPGFKTHYEGDINLGFGRPSAAEMPSAC